jgi:hypothetical protein
MFVFNHVQVTPKFPASKFFYNSNCNFRLYLIINSYHCAQSAFFIVQYCSAGAVLFGLATYSFSPYSV